MEIEGFYRQILRTLDERLKQADEHLTAGTGVQDWVAYQRLVEKRRTLLDVRTEIHDKWNSIFKREPVPPPV